MNWLTRIVAIVVALAPVGYAYAICHQHGERTCIKTTETITYGPANNRVTEVIGESLSCPDWNVTVSCEPGYYPNQPSSPGGGAGPSTPGIILPAMPPEPSKTECDDCANKCRDEGINFIPGCQETKIQDVYALCTTGLLPDGTYTTPGLRYKETSDRICTQWMIEEIDFRILPLPDIHILTWCSKWNQVELKERTVYEPRSKQCFDEWYYGAPGKELGANVGVAAANLNWAPTDGAAGGCGRKGFQKMAECRERDCKSKGCKFSE